MNKRLPDSAPAMKICRNILCLLVSALIWAGAAQAAQPLTVFAAASLKTALDEVAAGWDGPVVVSYGGSGTIARQVVQGAPADLVVLANTVWMDWLAGQGGLTGAVVPLLGNRLVVIGAAGEPLLEPQDLSDRLGDERLAVGQTLSVPAGIYAKVWLQGVGLWSELAPRLAETENVRAALALVARGETPLGIVYASDAVADPRVRVVYEVPADSHPPIAYPAAVTAYGHQDRAAEFLAYLASDQAMQVFLRNGFLPAPGLR